MVFWVYFDCGGFGGIEKDGVVIESVDITEEGSVGSLSYPNCKNESNPEARAETKSKICDGQEEQQHQNP